MSIKFSRKPQFAERHGTSTTTPIVKRRNVRLSPKTRRHIEKTAEEIVQCEPQLARTDFFGPSVKVGLEPKPHILIGDKREIRLLETMGLDPLEYRIALLAGSNDQVVLAGPRCRAFETYLQELLGLQNLNVLNLPFPQADPPRPTASRCMDDRLILEQLLAAVRKGGGATLIPFIAAGSVWNLAKRLSLETGEIVSVAGPPPNLTQRVNDKLWFAKVARNLLGQSATPPVHSAYGPAALVGHVQRLSQKWEQLVVKVPDSAGSLGNIPLRSQDVRNQSAKQLHHYLTEMVFRIAQTDTYPLMVEVWDCNVLCSPSVQLWIPAKEDGDPVIEGVYVQATAGAEGKFVGATPAELSSEQDGSLCEQAMQLGRLFQALGYFGRCSFDAVLSGSDTQSAQLHWIECNGRWGGVSIPLTFMNRLFKAEQVPAHVICQRSYLSFPATPFAEAAVLLDDLLFVPQRGREGIVFTSPTGIETGTGVQLMAFGSTSREAADLVNEACQRLNRP